MRLIFMGTPQASVPTLRRLLEDGHDVVAVWTQPDRPSGRGYAVKESPVKEFALNRNLQVEQPEKIKIEQARDLFASYEADAAIVVAYGRILPPSFLRAPRLGCINVHFSLLPKYRGAAPVNWAIVEGERETGVTTMLMDEGLDTGAILLQSAIEIGERETATALMNRLAEKGAELLSETLGRFDEIEPRAQNDSEATFAPILKREDGLIDWSQDAFRIERQVRGFDPFPGAHTIYKSRRFIIRQAVPVGAQARRGAAGEIVEVTKNEIIVGCGGESELQLQAVQPEGKPLMAARDFINGARVSMGERFG
ncbi:MAG: methionyl-tRNA formyltransferase [Pyrinomonadaceae bacterium]|nr:methionyl-tRNA formyltransferase [Pyrinomonadaceae bacterium]